MEVGLVVESGDAREVHHVALLLGYGAAAVNPYLAFESIEDLIRDGALTGVEPAQAVRNMVKALGKGVLKVMSKMGISTVVHDGADLRGRRPVGPRRRVLHRHVLPARRRRHRRARRGGGHAPPPAYPGEPDRAGAPPAGDGRGYQWRREARCTCSTPRRCSCSSTHPVAAVRRLRAVHADRRRAVRGGRHPARALHAEAVRPPVPLDEVEPVSEIVKRFNTGAMSYGSIAEAHQTLAIAMNRLGGGPTPVRAARTPTASPATRRPAPLGDQAGGQRPVRRDQRVPGQRRRHPDQDGAGRQAGEVASCPARSTRGWPARGTRRASA